MNKNSQVAELVDECFPLNSTPLTVIGSSPVLTTKTPNASRCSAHQSGSFDNNIMTIEEAIKVLKDHNIWRCGADTPPTNPKELTLAINTIIKHYERNKK